MPNSTPHPLPRPFDAALAERALERWQEAAAKADADLRAWASGFVESPGTRTLFDAVCGNSPFLGQIMTREVAFVRTVMQDGYDAAFASLMAGLESGLAAEDSIDRLMTELRIAKRRAALLIAMADIAGEWTLEQVTGALCDTAETALRLACAHLLRRAGATGALTLPDPDHPWVGSGLIVLGMGKLGARELNYSSDIDLIVLYDDAVVQTPQPDRLSRTFVKIARDLVRIMDERTKDGYVFRTDLRLRPDPGATPPAVSVSAAEVYYASVGQNWERAAMIKARPVAGDMEAGARFVRMLEPFVWRRNLDFAAIQDIHSIKRQINAHKGHRTITVNGHDVKVGRGGIREIEFFAQTQQLIFGGRDVRVRPRPTLAAIRALSEVGRVPAEVVPEMDAAYRFLRQVEHRIQMIDDQQTHKIPADDAGVEHLAVFLGYDTADAFRADLLAHFGRVEDRYADLFEESPSLAGPGNLVFTGTDDDPGTVETLSGMGYKDPSRVIGVVGAWHRGRYRATRSARARELLTELVPTLLAELAKTPQPDAALMKFDAFLERLPAGVGLFSLFYANSGLLALVAEIMGTAPELAETLSRNPSLLEAVLSPGFFDPLPDREGLAPEHARALAPARDFEDALALSRRWANDQRFRAGVHILRNITDGDGCGPFLAAIADLVVGDLAQRVHEDFARRHGQVPGGAWVVVAMGKLGSRQMTITSDIDLIVVYDVPPATRLSDGTKPLSINEYYIRLTQRLTNAITAPMGDGRLYEVDMRLRPSGNAGPLATSLDSFIQYQAKDAWTWEQMALTRARVVGGDPALTTRVDAAIREALTRPRDPDRLLWDVADMRRRIDKEFGTDNPWNLKYARGGLIDIEFVSQYLQLRHAHTHPDILSPDMAGGITRAAELGLLDGAIAADLVEALRLWRRVQGFLRLTTSGVLDESAVSETLAAGVARAAYGADAIDFPTLAGRIRGTAATAYRHFQALIEEPASRLAPPTQTEEPSLP